MVYLNITLSNKSLPPFWQLSVGKAAGRGMNSEKLLQAVCAGDAVFIPGTTGMTKCKKGSQTWKVSILRFYLKLWGVACFDITFCCIVFVDIFESGLLIHLDFVHFVPPVGHGVRAKYGEADDRFDAKLISSAGSVLLKG